jgi:pyridoxine/pyridoxamine 5'-phosphate oxidase
MDEAVKKVYVTRPSQEQIEAIRSLKKDVLQIREELASRIKALLPAKKNNGRAHIKNTNY